jgi:predicted patatin/cPLA2 family phospholipase
MEQTHATQSRPLVVYFSAGAMSGIFSAGLSKAFAEAGLKPYIDTVYGNSAGGLTALCFLSDQIDMGAKLYWEDLDGKKYIRWDRLPGYVGKAFLNAVFRTKFELQPVFDIDYIQNILTTRRKINFENIKASGTKLYMIVYNLVTSSHDYLEVASESDIIPTLRATAGGHPAYPHSEKIHGNMYVDGGTIDDKNRIISIIKRHPDKEIICVLNNPKWKQGAIMNFLNKTAIGLVMLPFFGIKEAWKTANSDFATVDIIALQKDHPYLHFIGNDLNGFQMSTNPEHHKLLFKRGYELGKEFVLSGSLRTVPHLKESPVSFEGVLVA